MKPLIGITTYYVSKGEDGDRKRGLPGQDLSMSSTDYAESIKESGGVPVEIPVLEGEEYIEEIIEKIDGIIFSGGPDIDPNHYNESLKDFSFLNSWESSKIVPKRDDIELKLLDYAIEKDLPILGICRGMQLINIYHNGSLNQDFRKLERKNLNHRALNGPKWFPTHDVELKNDSKVKEIYSQDRIRVNSFHHQVIKDLGGSLKVAGISEDSMIEAIEEPDKDFLVGVQWHPEAMIEKKPKHLSLFKEFVESAIN